MINRHAINKTEPLPPYVNHAGRLVTVTRVTYSNGIRQTYEEQRGGGMVLVRTELPSRPLPHLTGWTLNLPEGESHGV